VTRTNIPDTEERTMATAHDPIRPGEVLAEEFLTPLGISQYRLAKAIGVAPTRIGEIVHGTRGISADTALRLSRALGTSERFWMNPQRRYDLQREREAHAAELEQIQTLIT
jgi:addiction module HigA family antidote